jgi:hypothetical protein
MIGRGQPSGFATVENGWEMIHIGSERVVLRRSAYGAFRQMKVIHPILVS